MPHEDKDHMGSSFAQEAYAKFNACTSKGDSLFREIGGKVKAVVGFSLNTNKSSSSGYESVSTPQPILF